MLAANKLYCACRCYLALFCDYCLHKALHMRYSPGLDSFTLCYYLFGYILLLSYGMFTSHYFWSTRLLDNLLLVPLMFVFVILRCLIYTFLILHYLEGDAPPILCSVLYWILLWDNFYTLIKQLRSAWNFCFTVIVDFHKQTSCWSLTGCCGCTFRNMKSSWLYLYAQCMVSVITAWQRDDNAFHFYCQP